MKLMRSSMYFLRVADHRYALFGLAPRDSTRQASPTCGSKTAPLSGYKNASHLLRLMHSRQHLRGIF